MSKVMPKESAEAVELVYHHRVVGCVERGELIENDEPSVLDVLAAIATIEYLRRRGERAAQPQ